MSGAKHHNRMLAGNHDCYRRMTVKSCSEWGGVIVFGSKRILVYLILTDAKSARVLLHGLRQVVAQRVKNVDATNACGLGSAAKGSRYEAPPE